MDPTKSFDHLDPKLKETYARVMGTATGGTGDAAAAQYPPSQPAANPSVTTPQNTFQSAPPTDPHQSQSNTTPPGQSFNATTEPNQGTSPAVNSMPMGATTMISQPAAPPAPEATGPSNSSFFSNPSPATTEPSQPATADANLSAPFVPPATEPAPVTVTPYSQESAPQPAVPAMGTAEQYSQPLPSPASIAQNAQHETSALLRVLYIIAAVIFFAIYTVFWIKVFNLPFLF